MENSTEKDIYMLLEEANTTAVLAISCLSIIFLLLLVLVFFRRKEYRTTMGKNVISLSCTLIIAYTLLVTSNTMEIVGLKFTHGMCYAFALLIHFVYLAAMVWCNAIAFDIMIVLTAMRSKSSRSSARFLKYCAYVWFTTSAIWTPSLIVDYFELLPEDYRPKYADTSCFLNTDWGYYIFYMIPVIVIIVINFIFFALTLKTIIQVQKQCTQLEIRQQRKSTCLYFKLILVMGLLRITMFLEEFFPNDYLFFAICCFNSFYGVYMFLILAFKCPTRNCLSASSSMREKESTVTSVTTSRL